MTTRNEPRPTTLNTITSESPRLPLEDIESGAALCVLASGSSGNCSVLLTKRGGVRRITLIDLGLSPKRTFRHLHELGLRPDQIDDALVTHLDHDHFNPNWLAALPKYARLRMHVSHARDLGIRARSRTLRASPDIVEPSPNRARIVPFDLDPFDLDEGLHVAPMIMTHDDSGVAVFRFDLPGFGGACAGFCTDLGHATDELADHLTSSGGVGVLAIESNYCPKMQVESDRPDQLKRRIMGGAGHLSNQQALEFIQAVRPREHVVLLHLSRQCNDPAVVSELHAGSDYALTISKQFDVSRWVRIAPEPRSVQDARPVMIRPAKLKIGVKVHDTLPLFS